MYRSTKIRPGDLDDLRMRMSVPTRRTGRPLAQPCRLAASSICLALALSTSAAGAEPPDLGLVVTVRGTGIFSPVVMSAEVAEVGKSSPAELSGIKVSDQILEIDGTVIGGAAVWKLQPLLDKFQSLRAGEGFRIKVKHVSGEIADLKIVMPFISSAPK